MLEESFKESEEKLRTILENSRDGINMFDLRTKKYLYMSPSQEQLCGFTMEEINNFSAEEAYVRFFVMDVIFDENDKPVDIYYVEANEASIKILGSDYSNKYLKDIIPNYESNWLEIFGEAAFTGKSVRVELPR
jgi:PAS domain-containing protein